MVCYGPPDTPHERHIIREYTRQHDGWRIAPPAGLARLTLEGAPVEHKIEWAKHGDQIELRCRHCRFDEKRRLDRVYGETYPPFSAVFDALAAAGVWEISARGLAGQVWPR